MTAPENAAELHQGAGAASDEARAVVPTASSPQAVSPVPASIPSVFLRDWSAEGDTAGRDNGFSGAAVLAAVWAFLAKSARWEGASIEEWCAGFAKQQQARLGLCLAIAEAMRAASAIEARRAETGTGSVHESAVPQADAQSSARAAGGEK